MSHDIVMCSGDLAHSTKTHEENCERCDWLYKKQEQNLLDIAQGQMDLKNLILMEGALEAQVDELSLYFIY